MDGHLRYRIPIQERVIPIQERVISRIGEEGYSIAFNTYEHLVKLCNGKLSSKQVSSFVKSVACAVVGTTAKAACTVVGTIVCAGSNVADSIATAAFAGM